MTRVTAKGITWLILKEVVRLHGIPELIVSDRDIRFTSIFWKELQRLMGTKLLMSTAFHPQMDGATKQINRSISQILCTVGDNNQKNWLEKCSMVEFTINSSVNTTTGYATFELNYRYIPRLGQHISMVKLEQSITSSGIDTIFHGKFYHWIFLRPVLLVIVYYI